jgi:hypothetical protein
VRALTKRLSRRLGGLRGSARRFRGPGVTDPARSRWLILALVRLAGAMGAVLGIVLLARADASGPRVLGIALVAAALWMTATVPLALARRWRS